MTAQLEAWKAKQREINPDSSEDYSKIGTMHSMLAGVGSGFIAIPKGLFSLGATLMDLGADTNKAAEVEKWFDDWTDLDEKAEATTAGKITETLVNLGVPGVFAFSKGAQLANHAIRTAKSGKYFRLTDEALKKTSKKTLELNRKGKTARFITAATAGGIADGVFVGDVEQIGTFGDLLGGPTAIDRDDGEYDATRQLINRVKFGTEGALFTGVLFGTGRTLKKLAKRSEADRYASDELTRLHHKILGKVASKGKTPSLFPHTTKQTGRTAADTHIAEETNLELGKSIDGIFPLWRPMAQKLTEPQRKETLELLDLSFRSGTRRIDPKTGKIIGPQLRYKEFIPGEKIIINSAGDTGVVKGFNERNIKMGVMNDNYVIKGKGTQKDWVLDKRIVDRLNRKTVADFGPMDDVVRYNGKDVNVRDKLKSFKMADKDIESIFGSLSIMRGHLGSMISDALNVLSPKEINEYLKIPGERLKNYLTSTYDIFSHKAGIMNRKYPPASRAMNEAIKLFQRENLEAIARAEQQNAKIASTGGKNFVPVPEKLTNQMAETEVNKFLKEDILPGTLKFDFKSTEPIIKLPSWFNTKTMLDDIDNMGRRGFTPLSNVTKQDRKIFEDLFGKQRDVMRTILSTTGKLSLITRKHQYLGDVVEANSKLSKIADDEIAKSDVAGFIPKTKQILYDSFQEAQRKTGLDMSEFDVIGKDIGKDAKSIDPSRKLAQGLVSAVDGKIALREVAEAFNGTKELMKSQSNVSKLYQQFILYPKATSQLAKTVLSPITHARNFISAGAFATANGIIPNGEAIKTAYQALQIPLIGTRKQNDLYRELLELGVVNSNVRLGDLQNLLADVKFGETINSSLDSGKLLGRMFNKMSKFKKGAEEFYTAEDDFWKIASWVSEKSRLGKSFETAGIKPGDMVKRFDGQLVEYNEKFLKEEAADIVKNNIPNYAYVSDFVKGLRKMPIGNFVSFPAEILRTSTNIVNRGLKEWNYKHTLADGTVVNPLRGIGFKRLLGMGVTTVAVPAAAVEMAKTVYDVTEDEMEALRRYVADWSKNSTLVPIRDKETGKLKYVDFSHANAYDTLTRPIQTVLYSIAAGREDEDGIMDDFMTGVFSATKELALPFVGESIWTEALADLYFRRGRTQEGAQVWNREDTYGDMIYKGLGHLVKSQAPFSYEQLKRLKMAINEDFDKYGQTYGLGEEAAGFFGGRIVDVNPERGLAFKIAEYEQGVRDSRSLFTRTTRLGAGPVTPKEIIDAYINANRALFEVRRNMMKDLDGAQILGVSEDRVVENATRRISRRDVGTIREGIFRPLPISSGYLQAFEENSRKMGVANPMNIAFPIIGRMQEMLSLAPLSLEMFPPLYNPFDEEGMAEGGRVGFAIGGEAKEIDDMEEGSTAAAVWITEPEEIKKIFNYDFKQYFLSNIWKSKPKPAMSAGTAGAQAKAPMDIATPEVDPSLLGKGPNMTNSAAVTSTGLTQTENALLSQEEKAIRLRQRGIG